MDNLPEWFQVALAGASGLIGGIVGTMRVVININKKFHSLELDIEKLGRIRDARFAEAELNLENRLKKERHEIYGTIQTQMAGPIQLDMTQHRNEIRADIQALAIRVGALDTHIAVLIDRKEQGNHVRREEQREGRPPRGKS